MLCTEFLSIRLLLLLFISPIIFFCSIRWNNGDEQNKYISYSFDFYYFYDFYDHKIRAHNANRRIYFAVYYFSGISLSHRILNWSSVFLFVRFFFFYFACVNKCAHPAAINKYEIDFLLLLDFQNDWIALEMEWSTIPVVNNTRKKLVWMEWSFFIIRWFLIIIFLCGHFYFLHKIKQKDQIHWVFWKYLQVNQSLIDISYRFISDHIRLEYSDVERGASIILV